MNYRREVFRPRIFYLTQAAHEMRPKYGDHRAFVGGLHDAAGKA